MNDPLILLKIMAFIWIVPDISYNIVIHFYSKYILFII